VVSRGARGDNSARANDEAEEEIVYQTFASEIHRMWLEEFERKAAAKRRLPRRDHEARARRFSFRRLGGPAGATRPKPELASRGARAQQCT
jgi:hypothetical protein